MPEKEKEEKEKTCPLYDISVGLIRAITKKDPEMKDGDCMGNECGMYNLCNNLPAV